MEKIRASRSRAVLADKTALFIAGSTHDSSGLFSTKKARHLRAGHLVAIRGVATGDAAWPVTAR